LNLNLNLSIQISEEEDAEDMEAEEVQETAEPLPELSTVELYALRQKKLNERKERIARLGSAVIENPQENVNIYWKRSRARQVFRPSVKSIYGCTWAPHKQ
jgi:hypothetical protein